jgi:hypothetical protein
VIGRVDHAALQLTKLSTSSGHSLSHSVTGSLRRDDRDLVAERGEALAEVSEVGLFDVVEDAFSDDSDEATSSGSDSHLPVVRSVQPSAIALAVHVGTSLLGMWVM